MNGLRCYVCGEELKEEFYLVFLTEWTDRVFVVDERCIARVDAQAHCVRVRTEEKR